MSQEMRDKLFMFLEKKLPGSIYIRGEFHVGGHLIEVKHIRMTLGFEPNDECVPKYTRFLVRRGDKIIAVVNSYDFCSFDKFCENADSHITNFVNDHYGPFDEYFYAPWVRPVEGQALGYELMDIRLGDTYSRDGGFKRNGRDLTLAEEYGVGEGEEILSWKEKIKRIPMSEWNWEVHAWLAGAPSEG